MKLLQVAGLAVVVLLLFALPAFAADQPPPAPGSAPANATAYSPSFTGSGAGLAAGLGMGLTIIGAGIGFGRIGAAALESMARQPEVAGRVQTAMLIIAAMLEGATLASVVFLFVIGLAKATF